MEDDKKMVIELTDRDVAALRFAMSELRMSEQELIREFISTITYRAYRSYRLNTDSQGILDSNYIREDEDPEKTTKNLQEMINRWAIRKDGINYFLIRSYLKALDIVGEDAVTKDEMLKQFLSEVSDIDLERVERRFEINLRMMRSAAPKAYGRIFAYNINTKIISLDELVKDTIIGLKDEFLA